MSRVVLILIGIVSAAVIGLICLYQTRVTNPPVIHDDPGYTRAVFSRLRPTVPQWLPDALNGVLLEVTLE